MAQNDPRIFIPTTISKQAQEMLKNLTMNILTFSTPYSTIWKGGKN